MTKKEEVFSYLDGLEEKEKGSAFKVAIPVISRELDITLIDAQLFKKEWISNQN